MSAASIGDGTPHVLPNVPLTHHSKFEPWIPKSIVCLRGGFARRFFVHDLIAGLTVGVIAIPLALAFAIASHVAPERGLYTAIVAGFLVSLLGGSRVAIAGPTGAFVVIIAGVVDQFGYEGLALASLMAGAILLIMGAFKLGAVIKFIPYPVTTGFTSGIALIIFSLVGVFSATLGAWFRSKPRGLRAFDFVIGSLFIGLGVRLALASNK